ncbi:MAG: prepilin-type N-terminal cleavage/methylation domain-containing protein [Deltaproteobacteria bacterium]|nr:prepilin-type N-terminal cleavage/methylation domain-containing protein [Deltaproteobacteria bacterium]
MKKNGFSLIELMVIVAIIAFFIGLTLPQFLKERSNQKQPEGPQAKVSKTLEN